MWYLSSRCAQIRKIYIPFSLQGWTMGPHNARFVSGDRGGAPSGLIWLALHIPQDSNLVQAQGQAQGLKAPSFNLKVNSNSELSYLIMLILIRYHYPWESVKFFVCAVLHTHRFLDLLACIVDQLGGSNTSVFYLYLADRAFTYFFQDPESSIWTTSYESCMYCSGCGFRRTCNASVSRYAIARYHTVICPAIYQGMYFQKRRGFCGGLLM